MSGLISRSSAPRRGTARRRAGIEGEIGNPSAGRSARATRQWGWRRQPVRCLLLFHGRFTRKNRPRQNGHGLDEVLRIGMKRAGYNFLSRPHLDEFPQIHHSDSRCHVPQDRTLCEVSR